MPFKTPKVLWVCGGAMTTHPIQHPPVCCTAASWPQNSSHTGYQTPKYWVLDVADYIQFITFISIVQTPLIWYITKMASNHVMNVNVLTVLQFNSFLFLNKYVYLYPCSSFSSPLMVWLSTHDWLLSTDRWVVPLRSRGAWGLPCHSLPLLAYVYMAQD